MTAGGPRCTHSLPASTRPASVAAPEQAADCHAHERAPLAYDAFISYSHAADERLAPALQSALQRLARPWFKRRALHLFRDDTSLAVTPELWPAIERALQQSRYFIYLASPEAAASEWVQREVAWWLSNRAAESLLIVLTAGELHWDDPGNDFDRARSSTVPPALYGAFPQEPRYLDLRWATREEHLSLRLPQYRDAVAELAATLHGRSVEDIESEDLRQHRRTLRIAWSAVTLLILLTVTSVITAVVAVRQRNLAEERRTAGLARQLAAEASALVLRMPDRLHTALGLASEALRRLPTPETERVARSLLALMPRRIVTFEPGGEIMHVAFSPDGRRLATTSMEVVALWPAPAADSVVVTAPGDSPGHQALWSEGTDAPPRGFVFSPDGRWVAYGVGATVEIRDAGSGDRLETLEAGDTVRAVAFDGSGRRLAASGDDGIVRVWSLPDVNEMSASEHGSEVDAVAFSPDGKQLASLSDGGGLCVREMGSDEEALCRATQGIGMGLAWLPDSRRLVTISENYALLWDLTGEAPLARMEHVDATNEAAAAHLNWVQDVTVSPDGRYIATAGRDFTARVWDAESGQELSRMRSAAPVTALRFSPDGRWLATSSDDGTVRVWDALRGTELLRGAHDANVRTLAFDRTGTRLASGAWDGTATLWQLTAGDEHLRLMHDRRLRALALSADGARVAAIDDDGLVLAWKTIAAGPPLRARPGFGMRRILFAAGDTMLIASGTAGIYRVSLMHHNGDTLLAAWRVAPERVDELAISTRYVAVTDRRSLSVYSATSGDSVARIEAPEGVARLALTADGSMLAAELLAPEMSAGDIVLYLLPAAREVVRVKVQERLDAIAVAPGVLAALGRDSLLLWTVAGNTTHAVPVETAESADFLAFSPDGSHLFSGHDNQVTVRDTRTGRILARITHEPGIDALRSGPTGEYFATLASGQVRVWDARTGQSIAEIGGAYIHDMRFTSDGRWLATADGDGAVALRVWRGEDLLREACARLGAPMDSTEWRTWLGDEPYRPACAAPGR